MKDGNFKHWHFDFASEFSPDEFKSVLDRFKKDYLTVCMFNDMLYTRCVSHSPIFDSPKVSSDPSVFCLSALSDFCFLAKNFLNSFYVFSEFALSFVERIFIFGSHLDCELCDGCRFTDLRLDLKPFVSESSRSFNFRSWCFMFFRYYERAYLPLHGFFMFLAPFIFDFLDYFDFFYSLCSVD